MVHVHTRNSTTPHALLEVNDERESEIVVARDVMIGKSHGYVFQVLFLFPLVNSVVYPNSSYSAATDYVKKRVQGNLIRVQRRTKSSALLSYQCIMHQVYGSIFIFRSLPFSFTILRRVCPCKSLIASPHSPHDRDQSE